MADSSRQRIEKADAEVRSITLLVLVAKVVLQVGPEVQKSKVWLVGKQTGVNQSYVIPEQWRQRQSSCPHPERRCSSNGLRFRRRSGHRSRRGGFKDVRNEHKNELQT